MKFKFVKEDDDIKVLISDGQAYREFDYIEMVNLLYRQRQVEDCEFQGEISDEEKSMIEKFICDLREIAVSNVTELNSVQDGRND